MRRVIVFSLLLLVMFSVPALASTYIKVDDNTLRVLDTEEKSSDLTVPMIKHEIDGMNRDITVYEDKIAGCNTRKAKYEEMLIQCEDMDIVEKTKPVEPIIE